MLDMVHSSTTGRIAAVVGDVLQKHQVDGPVEVEVELSRYGLTSIDMVELMLGVEAEFDVAIPPAEITLNNFKSIATIAALVARLSPAG